MFNPYVFLLAVSLIIFLVIILFVIPSVLASRKSIRNGGKSSKWLERFSLKRIAKRK